MRFTYKSGVRVQPLTDEEVAAILQRAANAAPRSPATASTRRRRTKSRKPAPPPPRRLRHLLARGAVACAVLAVAAGCASLNPDIAKAWKIEPVLNVTHTLQNSQAYYTMGRYHDGSQAWDKAVEAYRKAIAADAQNIEAYNALGVALARGGQLAQAETTLRQAVALDPNRPHLRSNLGYVLLLADKPADAVAELEAAVRQDGGNMTAAANLRDARERATQLALNLPPGERNPAAGAVASVTPTVDTPTPQSPEGQVRADSTAMQVSVPMPITSATVAMPAAGIITVAAPIQVASVATLQPELAAERLTSPEGAEQAATLRVIDQPTVSALDRRTTEQIDDGVNRPLVRQTIARRSEGAESLAMADQLSVRLEVSNGNGVTGMAARVSKWLGEQGIRTASLTNKKPFNQETTTVQYRSGHEAAAHAVARSLPAPAVADLAPTDGLRGDVRVVLGRDWVKVGACLDVKTCRPADTALAEASPAR